MIGLLLAAVIVLPPNTVGMWQPETPNPSGGMWIEMFEDNSFEFHLPEQSTVLCKLTSQDKTYFGYTVVCEGGPTGELRFYDTGVMNFNGIRYKYGGSHDGD